MGVLNQNLTQVIQSLVFLPMMSGFQKKCKTRIYNLGQHLSFQISQNSEYFFMDLAN